ncbi:MAG: hypothetical protein RR362_05620, partial [Raoultibacter sp.]
SAQTSSNKASVFSSTWLLSIKQTSYGSIDLSKQQPDVKGNRMASVVNFLPALIKILHIPVLQVPQSPKTKKTRPKLQPSNTPRASKKSRYPKTETLKNSEFFR